uniref:Uncharacterized protein n=1 Tax=Paramormyrops kingsleyae TaxID=1676925 RepID=A0A3B3SGK4_9TELE
DRTASFFCDFCNVWRQRDRHREPCLLLQAAVANAGAANGIGIPNGLNPGAGNGMLLNGQAQLGQLIPIGQPMFIPQSGLPIGQAGMPLVPGMGLQQALAFPMAQPQLPVPQMQPANGVSPLGQGGGSKVRYMMLDLNISCQILPLGAGNTIMQPMMGAQGAGNAARMVKVCPPPPPLLKHTSFIHTAG